MWKNHRFPDQSKFRLPNNANPQSYDLRIQPNLTNDKFYGEVNIFVEVQSSVHYITLNIKDLVIQKLVLDNCINQTSYLIEEKHELIHITCDDGSLVDPGEHLIHVEYTGKMRSDSIGLFKSVVESEGKKLYVLEIFIHFSFLNENSYYYNYVNMNSIFPGFVLIINNREKYIDISHVVINFLIETIWFWEWRNWYYIVNFRIDGIYNIDMAVPSLW